MVRWCQVWAIWWMVTLSKVELANIGRTLAALCIGALWLRRNTSDWKKIVRFLSMDLRNLLRILHSVSALIVVPLISTQLKKYPHCPTKCLPWVFLLKTGFKLSSTVEKLYAPIVWTFLLSLSLSDVLKIHRQSQVELKYKDQSP